MGEASGGLGEIASLLVGAALTRQFTSVDAWDYGWSKQEYRRSSRAALGHDASRRVQLSRDGVDGLERAMQLLLKQRTVRESYDAEELWGVVAGLIGRLPMLSEVAMLERDVHARLAALIVPPESVVVMPIANLDPGNSPIDVGPLLLGRLGDGWRERLRTRAKGTGSLHAGTGPWWHSLTGIDRESDVVLLAHFGRLQLGRAVQDAEEGFENLVALALVLEPDLDGRELFSLRGDSHRPGIRGLAVDRQALRATTKSSPTLTRELLADVFVSGVLGANVSHRAYGERPFPLHQLLNGHRLADAQFILTSHASPQLRLKVAARWHAKAYWSSGVEDAVLALGIAFEALLSEGNPSPGRVLSERFAFLAREPSERPARYRLFNQEYYPARSSVAHGSKKRSIDYRFVRGMAADLRHTFAKIASLIKANAVESESGYNQMFDALKWGTGA